jgi:phenylacetate-CoA ligase
MEIATTADENTELSLFVELAATATATDALAFEVTRAVRAELERSNGEFLAYAPPERRTARVSIRALGDPEYFPIGVKHRSTR